MDLKHWSDSLKVWLLHIIDYVTQYIVSCAVDKKKEVLLKKIFKNWVAIFGSPPKKILVDNGGKFTNTDFIKFS